ncbi:MAG: hypothetical protein ABI895_20015 [Deltaproteobacteria bacterium]
MAFAPCSHASLVAPGAPLVGMPIVSIGAPLVEPPLITERRAMREPSAAPFLLERRSRAPATDAPSSAVRIQQTLEVGPPRKPPAVPQRRQKAPAPFEPCAAPRRALTLVRQRVRGAPSAGPRV